MDRKNLQRIIRNFEETYTVCEGEDGEFYVSEKQLIKFLTLLKHELKEKPYVVITATGSEEATSLGEAEVIKEAYSCLGRNAVITTKKALTRGV